MNPRRRRTPRPESPVSSRVVPLKRLPGFAGQAARRLRPGDRVALIGPLGSGKTTFAFHLLRALGMEKNSGFSSPTFAIHNRYACRGRIIHHMDAYRLNSWDEFVALDLPPILEGDRDVVLIEWADRFPELAAACNKTIAFSAEGDRDDRRTIGLAGFERKTPA